MAIIDRKVFIIARNHLDYTDGALIGRDLPFTPMLARAITKEYPYSDSASRSGDEPTPEPLTREVLRQLALGAKDEAAAREMGMALRTYRRVVAKVMDQLGARSRFQAGYLAARRAWL